MNTKLTVFLFVLVVFAYSATSLKCFKQHCIGKTCQTNSTLIACNQVQVGITNQWFREIGFRVPANPANTSRFHCARYHQASPVNATIAGCIFENFQPCNATSLPAGAQVKQCNRCNQTDSCNRASRLMHFPMQLPTFNKL